MGDIGAVVGSVFSSSASKKAAKEMAAAIREATAEGKRQYDLTTESFKPYTEIGTNSIDDYMKMLQGGYDMKESPAAQYELQQGTKAMNRALASRGLSGSGTAVNRITELNQSIAAKDWNNQYNRLLDAINIGTSASAKTASAGGNYVAQLSNAASQIGNNSWNQANSLNSIYSNVANTMGNNALNLVATGTKAGWWGSGSSPGYQGGGGDYGSLNNVSGATDYSFMSY